MTVKQENKIKKKKSVNKYFFTFLSGTIATFSLPPFSVFPAIFLIIIPIFYLIHSKKLKDAFLIGFFLGFGWFLVSLYWISNAILVGGKEFFFMIPFIFIGLPACLSIFWALAFFVTNLIGKNLIERLILLSIFLPLFEWLRGNILSGFPWNMIGFSLSSPLGIAQTISIIGPYGQNILIVLLLTIPISIFYKKKIFALISTAFCGGFLVFSIYIFNINEISFTENKVRIVQPNFSHIEKWDKGKYLINQEKLLKLSKNNRKDSNLIVWPETAIVNFPENVKQDLNYIKKTILFNSAGTLITGIPRKVIYDNDKHYYNSMIVLNNIGKIVGKYDKIKLVPFGEYNPFKKFLGIIKIIANENEFSKGEQSSHFFNFNDLNLYPMICYEAIFPFRPLKGTSYDVIINITNDIWFGKTLGPIQHFWLAKQRAIETGIPMIRVSNSGISSLIAPNGKEIKSLKFGSSGFLELKIPRKFKETIYLKFGEKIYYMLTLILILLFLYQRKRLTLNY